MEDSVVRDLRQGASHIGQIDPELAAQIEKAEDISRVVWGHQASDASESADAPAPRSLGQYELFEQIGRGGMGTVWRALHTRLKRPVAVKLLAPSRMRDAQAVARFQREMEAVGRLDHPNLVRAYDAGEIEGQHYLAMELLDGLDLAKAVRTHGPMPIPEACEAIRQAATGLQHAHEHGLVHRDIKPSNLMLTTTGVVKLLDLGLARWLDPVAGDVAATNSGQVVGTGDFMAPEQAEDTRNADARSDVYSLGCTLYFLLVGRAPFADSQHNTFVKKLLAHAQKPIPPIRSLRPSVPEPLSAVLERMLEKSPADRFQTAAEVAKALESFATGKGLPTGTWHHVDPGGDSRTVLWGMSHKSLWTLGALLLLGLVAVFAYPYVGLAILLVRDAPDTAKPKEPSQEGYQTAGHGARNGEIFAAVREAFAMQAVVESASLGEVQGEAFRDMAPDDGVMVGFTMTIGRFGGGYRLTAVGSLQPAYLTPRGHCARAGPRAAFRTSHNLPGQSGLCGRRSASRRRQTAPRPAGAVHENPRQCVGPGRRVFQRLVRGLEQRGCPDHRRQRQTRSWRGRPLEQTGIAEDKRHYGALGGRRVLGANCRLKTITVIHGDPIMQQENLMGSQHERA